MSPHISCDAESAATIGINVVASAIDETTIVSPDDTIPSLL